MQKAIENLSPDGKNRPIKTQYDLKGLWQQTKGLLVGNKLSTESGHTLYIRNEAHAELIMEQIHSEQETAGDSKLAANSPEYKEKMLAVINTARTRIGLEAAHI